MICIEKNIATVPLQFAAAMENGSGEDEREQSIMEEDSSSSSSNDESDDESPQMRTSTSGGLQSYLRESPMLSFKRNEHCF